MEWIDSGSLVERVNFVANQLSNVQHSGVRRIIDRLAAEKSGAFSPEELVDRCLDLLGPVAVSEETRAALVEFASRQGEVTPRDTSLAMRLNSESAICWGWRPHLRIPVGLRERISLFLSWLRRRTPAPNPLTLCPRLDSAGA